MAEIFSGGVEMKRKRTEWLLLRLTKKKMRHMEIEFILYSALEVNTFNIAHGRLKRLKQKEWAYHVAFKRWLARKQQQGMVFWKDEVRG